MWRILLLIPLIFVQIQLKAQERQAFQIEFKQGSNAIEENFCTNSKTLEKMNSFLENIYIIHPELRLHALNSQEAHHQKETRYITLGWLKRDLNLSPAM